MLVETYNAGPGALAAYLGAGAIAVNVLALGVFLALLSVRKLSLADQRTRAGLRAKMAGANSLAIAGLLSALVNAASALWSSLAAGLCILFGGLGFMLLRKGWKFDAAPAPQLLAEDRRPPVVYIRSFKDDATSLTRRWPLWQKLMRFWMPTSFEQDLASIMNRIGPFVAVGKPGEPLPELGAARFYFSDDEWRPRVAELMDRARLVVIRSGTTANLWWEIDQAICRLPPTRLVLIVDGKPAETVAFEDRLAARIGWSGTIPSADPRRASILARIIQLGGAGASYGKVIYFGDDWRPSVEFIRLVYRLQYLLRFHNPMAFPLEMAFDNVLQEMGVPLWRPGPSRLKAAAIATFLGMLGAHHFYLGNKRRGVYYLAFWWTLVPLLLAWFDAAKLLLMDDQKFRQLMERPPPSPAA